VVGYREGTEVFEWLAGRMRYAAALEEIARVAILTFALDPDAAPLPIHLMRKR